MTRSSCKLTIVIALLSLASLSVIAADYHVIKTYHLGGEGGWDYLTLDSASRRLYLSRATHVIVVDADSGKTVGDIADTPGVHGIALAPELGQGFVSNGREGTITVFDLKTLSTVKKIKVGDNPDAIVYDPASKRIFTFNGRSHDASAVDASKGEVIGTINLDGKPEFAVSDYRGELFVNLEDKSELAVIDPHKLEIKSRWSLAPCQEPSGLAIDRKNRRLFSGCDNQMMAISNADTGKVVATVPICDGTDASAFDDETNTAFASCHDGNLTVIHEDSPDKYRVLQTVSTQAGARTMALDPKTHEIFTVTAKFGPPPAPTAENPRPRSTILPDSFVVLVVGK